MKRGRNLYHLLVLILLIVTSIIYFNLSKENIGVIENKNVVTAASDSAVLTSQADWESGINTNTDTTTSPGDVIMKQDVQQGAYLHYENDGAMSHSASEAGDGNESTYHSVYVAMGVVEDLRQEFGGSKSVSKVRALLAKGESEVTEARIAYCSVSCTTMGVEALTTTPTWYEYNVSPPQNATYIKIDPASTPADPSYTYIWVYELESYYSPAEYLAAATHTSASTQIDGSTTLQSWDSFTPSQTVPANTTLTYQFRSSVDGATWPDDWSVAAAYSGSPLDLSGITTRRYLQVKSNLANSDGASTPTLSAYTVNYTRDDTCDNFDHVDISPTLISLETNGTTTFTASTQDSSHNPLTGITYNWSATGGSIAGGNYTAPATAGTYTVNVTSSCGGSASATVTVTEPDVPDPPFVCTAPNYFDCDACGPILTVIKPTEDSIHYTGGNLVISWTPKESCGGVMYHAEQIRYRVKLSLNGGESYITLAEDLHDINFPNEAVWLSIMQDANWATLLQPTAYSYAIPNDASFLTSNARVKVYMYRADAHPHSYSPSTDATSEQFSIRSNAAVSEDCRNYEVRFNKPDLLIQNNKSTSAYYFNLTALDIESWPTFSYSFKASLYSKNTGSVIRNIDSENFVLNPKNLATINPDGSLVINQEGFPKAQNFTITATDPTCASSALLNISASVAVDDDPIPTDSNYIDVLVPDGDERWRLNNDYEIKWKLEEKDPRVVLYDIYLSLDSGESYPHTVIKNLPDDGTLTHNYHIPDDKELLSDKARIKVVGKDQEKRALLVGRSEEVFTIYQSLLGAVIKIIENNISELLIAIMTAAAATSIALLLTPLLSNQLTLSTIPEIFWGMVAKGKSKRKRWGQVYEASSAMPIPNARVELISTPDKRVVETTLSNSEGFFGFVASRGSYIIKTTKFGFENINHQESISRDTLALRDNYFGGEISVEGEGDKIIKVNIPLISSKESPRFVTIAKIFNILQNFLIIINWPLLLLGTVVSVVALYLTPTLLNLLILALYVPLWAYEVYLLFEPKSYGNVEREENHIPIDLALVRVLDQESRKLVRSVASNQKGRYTLLLPKGNYHQYAQKAGYDPSQEKSIYLAEGINSVHTNFGLRSRDSDFAQTA